MTFNFHNTAEAFRSDPEGVTDRELAQLRRSCRGGSTLLYNVVEEQNRRGLLRKPKGTPRSYLSPGVDGLGSGYFPERYRRISDYPAKDVSARYF